MADPAPSSINLGFLTILREQSGYVGGYLVTNAWGRPLEFRLSSPVQPNKVQQILYGPTLEPYLCGDLIGRKLLEKAATPVQYFFTDHPAALDLRLHVDMPVGLVTMAIRLAGALPPGLEVTDSVRCHDQFVQDATALSNLLERLGEGFDLRDPFLRIRDALSEARKLGVSSRAA